MKRFDIVIYLIFFLVALFSRLPLIEQFQSHWDGPQYSIAVIRYSFEQQTPAPPGYPLYIGLAKFFYLFLHDPHKAILAVSVLGNILGSLIFYFFGSKLYNRYVGIAAATIFLTGSTFYYFGLTAYAYGLLPVTTTLLAYIVYQIFIKNKQYGLLLGIIFGICFGLRPQETVQIGLLPLLGFIMLSKKEKIKSILIFLIITLLWFIPVTRAVGGLEKYFMLSYQFTKEALFNNSFIQHIELMIKGLLLSFGIASIFLLYYIPKVTKNIMKTIKSNIKVVIFYSSWILPGLLYNLFIRTEHAGYQMSYLSGLLILISYAIWQTTKKNKLIFTLIVILIASFNLYWFFYNRDQNYTKPYRPTSFHYSDIRKNDIKTGSKVNFVLKKFDPKTTLIISTEALWRPYSYYLKNYSYIALFGLDNTSIPYIYNRIDSKNWDMNWYQTKNFTVTIPSTITTVVFMDDAESTWIKNYPLQVINLPGNSNVTIIAIPSQSKIQYNYHNIEIAR